MRLRILTAILVLACGCGAPAQLPAAGPQPSITLAFGGDTMLARLVSDRVLRDGPRIVWGDVLPLLRDADLALVNLECCIAESGEPFLPRRVFYFNAHPKTTECLTQAGIDYVSLANNHALDYRAPALLETIRRLDEAGIAHAGAGANLQEATGPAFVEAKGIRVGVVSFADHFDLYAADSRRAGTNVISISTKGEDFARVRTALAAAREGGADLVVFSIHWGPNMCQAPPPPFRRFARAVLDAGADIFHGHSAHVFQRIEFHEGKPILYDTGDLLDDYRVDGRLRNDLQLLFLLQADRDRVVGVEMVPLRIGRMQVNRATGADFDWIEDHLREICSESGVAIRRDGDRLVARP